MKVLLKYVIWWYISGDNQQAILKLELPQKYYMNVKNKIWQFGYRLRAEYQKLQYTNHQITWWLSIIFVDNIFIYILCCHSDTCSYSHWCDWHLWHGHQSWAGWYVWWSHASTGEHLLGLYCILMISCPMELPFWSPDCGW